MSATVHTIFARAGIRRVAKARRRLLASWWVGGAQHLRIPHRIGEGAVLITAICRVLDPAVTKMGRAPNNFQGMGA